MQYRALGNTGMNVSEIGLGCEHLQGKPAAQVDEVVSAALDAGINIMDVFMSEPDVRTNIGNALRGKRDKAIVQGHIGATWKDGQYQVNHAPRFAQPAFEDLLMRMSTDYIDIGMLHFIDGAATWQRALESGTLEYAQQLKREGKIRCIGMSSHDPITALKAVRTGAIDVLMFSINPAYDLLAGSKTVDDLFVPDTFADDSLNGTHPDRAALYRECEACGVGITVMKSLAAGTLLSAERSPFGVAMSVAQCAHYALSRPAVASVLVGMQTAGEVATAIQYCDAAPEQRDYAAVLAHTPKYSLKGKCMYCNHCLPCPVRIDVAQVNKYLDMAEMSASSLASARQHYSQLERHAGECIQCGVCEARCPFSVQVRARMERAAALFGQ